MTTGEKIKAARIAAGMTQKELGNKCGMADSAIRRYESDRAKPKIETMVKIAKALGVEIGAILTLIPPEAVNKPMSVKVQDVLKLINAKIDQPAKDPYDATRAGFWEDIKRVYLRAATSDDRALHLFMDTVSSLLYGGYDFTNDEFKLIKAFSALNNDGQIKAIERVEELSEITRYKDGGDQ